MAVNEDDYLGRRGAPYLQATNRFSRLIGTERIATTHDGVHRWEGPALSLADFEMQQVRELMVIHRERIRDALKRKVADIHKAHREDLDRATRAAFVARVTGMTPMRALSAVHLAKIDNGKVILACQNRKPSDDPELWSDASDQPDYWWCSVCHQMRDRIVA